MDTLSGQLVMPEDLFLRTVSAAGNQRGYVASQAFGGELRLSRRVIPAWAIVLAILLFPIGLLFLLAKTDSTVLLQYNAAAGGIGFSIGCERRLASAIRQALMPYEYRPSLPALPPPP